MCGVLGWVWSAGSWIVVRGVIFSTSVALGLAREGHSTPVSRKNVCLVLLLATGALLGITHDCRGSDRVLDMNAPGYGAPGEKSDSRDLPCASKGDDVQREAPLGTEVPAEELERMKQENEKRQLSPSGQYEDKSEQ